MLIRFAPTCLCALLGGRKRGLRRLVRSWAVSGGDQVAGRHELDWSARRDNLSVGGGGRTTSGHKSKLSPGRGLFARTHSSAFGRLVSCAAQVES